MPTDADKYLNGYRPAYVDKYFNSAHTAPKACNDDILHVDNDHNIGHVCNDRL